MWKYIALSPVASEKYYNKPVLSQIMKLFGTVPIWEMSAWASTDEIQKVFQTVVGALSSWSNILIYPSGQIYRQGYESIKWKQSTYHIVQDMPANTKVVWLKTRWLWGSIWSMAWDNGKTSFWKAYLKSIWYVLANLIFFVPKREVNISIEDITPEIQKKKTESLNDFNVYLENFFNTEDGKKHEEPLKYLGHFFYYNDVQARVFPESISGSESDLRSTAILDTSSLDADLIEKISKKIALVKEIEVSTITWESNLVLDLFFDSLDVSEIKSYIQSTFEWAANPPITDLKSVWDLYVMASWLSRSEEALKPCDWWKEKPSTPLNDAIQFVEDDTILSLWKKSFKKNKNEAFMWDNIFWLQRKKDVVIKAYVVSHYIKHIPWERIGIMLPSVWSASLVILATYLAGKTPVMFNWTLWKEWFDHCVSFSKVDTILSSRNFYERIKNPFLEEYEKNWNFLFLEDTLKKVSLFVKSTAFIKSFYFPLPKAPDTAVVLFTSGSDSLPKAVALTHTNLIENIKWVFSVLDIKTDDRLIGFLPPFHSFGFTVNTVMPLITGLQIAYTPDPNDSKIILEIISHTWVTGLTATPTFLKMILSLAEKSDLQSLRYAVVGAEKCPEDVFVSFQKLAPKWVILEGYGITECSPVVSINPITGSKPGTVWKIISTLDCKILDIDTSKEIMSWEQWMIYVKWKSIFSWYLDSNLEKPFEEIHGELYYKTGDLGKLDTDNFLTITGRLKRFVKIAWEMVSLPYVEWVLREKYNPWDTLEMAVEALEEDGKVKICLFSVNSTSWKEVNHYLRERGVTNLIRISEVIKVDEIPVLWTGKTDYKVLKAMISFDKPQMKYDLHDVEWTLKKKLIDICDSKDMKIWKDSIFWKDIILDSVDVWELKVFIMKNYNVESGVDISTVETFWDLYDLVIFIKNQAS